MTISTSPPIIGEILNKHLPLFNRGAIGDFADYRPSMFQILQLAKELFQAGAAEQREKDAHLADVAAAHGYSDWDTAKGIAEAIRAQGEEGK